MRNLQMGHVMCYRAYKNAFSYKMPWKVAIVKRATEMWVGLINKTCSFDLACDFSHYTCSQLLIALITVTCKECLTTRHLEDIDTKNLELLYDRRINVRRKGTNVGHGANSSFEGAHVLVESRCIHLCPFLIRIAFIKPYFLHNQAHNAVEWGHVQGAFKLHYSYAQARDV